jgi:hypothetical protein
MILSTGWVSAAIGISVDNYYPTPVEAGDYFIIWLKVTNEGDNVIEDGAIRFKQTYPFSLDPGEEKEKILSGLEQKGVVIQRFRVRVDKEAKEGENYIAFEYKDCSGCVWKEKNIPITVIEFQTMFDVVLQEVTSEGVFIAIANIGKNPANAITVSIPEQEFFKTDLTSASIVGNLESGDYTIAAFKILPNQRGVNEKKELFVKLDYTDPFGIRRSVVKQILLNPSSLIGTSVAGEETQFGSSRRGQGSSLLTNFWFWASVVLIILLFRNQLKKIYRRLRRSKRILK